MDIISLHVCQPSLVQVMRYILKKGRKISIQLLTGLYRLHQMTLQVTKATQDQDEALVEALLLKTHLKFITQSLINHQNKWIIHLKIRNLMVKMKSLFLCQKVQDLGSQSVYLWSSQCVKFSAICFNIELRILVLIDLQSMSIRWLFIRGGSFIHGL